LLSLSILQVQNGLVLSANEAAPMVKEILKRIKVSGSEK
jgi:hypothetical protein